MKLTKTFIGPVWSSPFCRWQGALAEMSSLDVAADVTIRAFEHHQVDPADLTDIVLGITVPQRQAFFGSSTLASRVGAEGVIGPMVAQACATSVAAVHVGAQTIESDENRRNLVVSTDRTSNSPFILYPSAVGMGGAPTAENWVTDNFIEDPWSRMSAVQMAERGVADGQMSREELDDVAILRYEQYADALANDRAVQREYMLPVGVRQGRRTVEVDADAGIHDTSRDKLAELEPTLPGGSVTFGNQTHPADGTAGVILADQAWCSDILGSPAPQLLATGFCRLGKGDLVKAPVPAAMAALHSAEMRIEDLDIVVTHNPFTVNDIWFSRNTSFPLERMNPYGCTLVYGHAQAPVGIRGLAELLTALRSRGGGIGLFTGCAAGDAAGALVVRV